MPTYSYACTECGDRFDAVQAFSDASLTTCDKCNGRLRKLFGNVGVVFKGSGFYRTDSRESAKSSSNGSSGESGSTSESSSSSEKSSSEKSSSEKSSSEKSSAGSSSDSGSTAVAAASS
ncbi:FmdB family zinc ribbon protein [Mycolicibacterium sp. ND9-15]|uniref:FmdB family zinc ribbon protein n=1 Tax=Mycolicibacterium sp. ND9-15 TaxID=3042320 RepID=UPI002DDBFD6C|nr:FmdB family zinc ribbon protein [Mycolicibacterium sp. ND9-15]WSE55093.1 FmdB family zinc ribbon protein [Mycolicibacterium sp. ND9-15]